MVWKKEKKKKAKPELKDSLLKDPLRWSPPPDFGDLTAGMGHWNTRWWPKHLGESWPPPFSSGAGNVGRVGVTGVVVADDGHGECGSGGGGHVSWMPPCCVLSQFLRSGSRKRGRELRKAVPASGSRDSPVTLADVFSPSGGVVAGDIPVRRQCSSRAFRAIERIAVNHSTVVNQLLIYW